MATLRNLVLQTQGAGDGIAEDATEGNHIVRLSQLEALLSPLQTNSHAAVTKADTESIALTLTGQLLSGVVRRKTTGLTADEGLILSMADGLCVSLGTSASQAARGVDVAALQAAMAGKSNVGHTHPISDIDGLSGILAGKADLNHTHVIGDVTGLQTALDSKANTVHAHAIGDVTGLQTALDGKANTVHSHAIADVTGLQDALDGKAAAAHTHAEATQEAAGFLSAADKTKLDALSASEQWRASVATLNDLPLNTDPVGTCRLVRGSGAIYRCISTIGFLADQWMKVGFGKFAVTIGDGAATQFDVEHGLLSEDVVMHARLVANGNAILVAWRTLSDTAIRLFFEEAPVMSGVRVVVVG